MKMTTKSKIVLTCATSLFGVAALTSMAGPPVLIVAPPPPPPIVVVPPPPPVVVQPGVSVSVSVGVPESYTWDGSEYVGVIGDQYYYLGPDQAWLPLSSDRLARFHGWENDHHDWRDHATQNMKYRRDAQGHDHPMHDHDGH